MQALTPEERQILDTPPEKLTPEQSEKLYDIAGRKSTSPIATWPSESPANNRPTRNRRCSWPANWSAQAQQLQFTINYKRDANYDYWQNSGRLRANGQRAGGSRVDVRGQQGVSRTPTCRGPRSSTRKASPSGGW